VPSHEEAVHQHAARPDDDGRLAADSGKKRSDVIHDKVNDAIPGHMIENGERKK
jgi:hypothetical protein